TALAFYLATALLLAIRRRWSWSAAVLSIAFVTRHEAILFAPIWLVFAWHRGARLWRLWPLVWAIVVVNIGARITGLPLSASGWMDIRPSTWYGSGGWTTMAARTLQAWGPAIAALGFAGLPLICRSSAGRMVAWCLIVYFAAQTVVRA